MARGGGSGGKGDGGRMLATRVRSARGRKTASTRWLQRQLNDPYVAKAQAAGYRSRAAFKLAELDDRFQFIARDSNVLDLGAAPGGWCQVAAERAPNGIVVGADIQEIDPIPGVTLLQLDIYAEDAIPRLEAAFGGARVDVALSDMAPSTTGHKNTDQLRIAALAEAAYDVSRAMLKPGGAFAVKVFQGGAPTDMLAQLRQDFSEVRHAKPPASRADSAEIYLLAKGFRASV